MPNLTEYEKTLTELYSNEGRKGLHHYFVNHEGLSDDEAETKIDSLSITDVHDADGTVESGIIQVTRNADGLAVATEIADSQKMTVTFADGSTQEIDVAPDGSVVSPSIHVFESTPPQEESFLDKVKDAIGL